MMLTVFHFYKMKHKTCRHLCTYLLTLHDLISIHCVHLTWFKKLFKWNRCIQESSHRSCLPSLECSCRPSFQRLLVSEVMSCAAAGVLLVIVHGRHASNLTQSWLQRHTVTACDHSMIHPVKKHLIHLPINIISSAILCHSLLFALAKKQTDSAKAVLIYLKFMTTASNGRRKLETENTKTSNQYYCIQSSINLLLSVSVVTSTF